MTFGIQILVFKISSLSAIFQLYHDYPDIGKGKTGQLKMPLSTFSYIVSVSFIGGGNQEYPENTIDLSHGVLREYN
jgi:hypothetical protein